MFVGMEMIAAKIVELEAMPLEEAKIQVECIMQLVRERFCGTKIDFFKT